MLSDPDFTSIVHILFTYFVSIFRTSCIWIVKGTIYLSVQNFTSLSDYVKVHSNIYFSVWPFHGIIKYYNKVPKPIEQLKKVLISLQRSFHC